MRTLEKIDFTFANCEGFTKDADSFSYLYTSGIYKKLEKFGNNILESLYLDSYIFVFKKDSNILEETLGNEEDGFEPELTFTRLSMFNDISKISLSYSDGVVETINIEWNPPFLDSEYIDYYYSEENKNQKYVLLDNGDFVVYCGYEYDVNVRKAVEMLIETNQEKPK